MKNNIFLPQVETNSACGKLFVFLQIFCILFFFIFTLPVFSQEIVWNNIKIHQDISYFDEFYNKEEHKKYQHSSHLLDLYQPENCHSCPVVIYVHGGSWALGDKGIPGHKAKAFTDNNFIYVSINYRLSPDNQFPAQAVDVARAFYWVKKNINYYSGNPKQIFILGHSAGGHLAALIALNEKYLAEFDLIPSDIAGVIGLDSAAYHLPSLFAAEPENQFLFSWVFGDKIQDLESASPINYIKEGLTPPSFFLLVAGDREVSKNVNKAFYNNLHKYNYNVNIHYFSEENHVSIDYDLGKTDHPVFDVILNWINSILRKK